MLHPTIEELTNGKYNRYELALATARCARLITDEYVHQHDMAEKDLAANKESDRSLNSMIDRELRDEKAVHVAVNCLYNGIYAIDENAGARASEETAAVAEVTAGEGAEETAEEATAEPSAEDGAAL